jgi:hypothetical protein
MHLRRPAQGRPGPCRRASRGQTMPEFAGKLWSTSDCRRGYRAGARVAAARRQVSWAAGPGLTDSSRPRRTLLASRLLAVWLGLWDRSGTPHSGCVDPKTRERLAQVGGRGWMYSAGWDVTFSPRNRSRYYGPSPTGHDRKLIEQAHRSAMPAATAHLEGGRLGDHQATRPPFIRLCGLPSRDCNRQKPPGSHRPPRGLSDRRVPPSSATTPCSLLTCDSIA